MIRNRAVWLALLTEHLRLMRAGRARRDCNWRNVAVAVAIAVIALGASQAAAQCLTDDDCNDGRFCTVDHCIAFICFHSDRDCNDFNDCTRDSCDETHNTCVHEDLDFTAHCEDFNIFTTAERCDCGGKCVGLPILPVIVNATRCCVSVQCPSNQICVDTLCQPEPTSPPTPTRTRTPTVAVTRTPTPTPDNRPVLTINDASGNEGDGGTRNFVFTVSLSKTINQQVTFNFATADGSATAGSDYKSKSGTASIAANGLTVQLPGIGVLGDKTAEPDETFFVNITNVPSTVRVGRATGIGTIVNDDGIPSGNPGLGALSPHDSVANVGADTPITLTWTSPQRWRDLNAVDLRLRSETGIAIWLRFDVAAGTLGLIHPADVSIGPAFAPGSEAELAGDAVSVALSGSTVQTAGPDASTVNITFVFRFAEEAAGNTYLVDAAASNVAGDVREFDTIGTISVAPALACPGDCNHDGIVTVDELLTGVSMVISGTNAPCGAFDTDASGTVGIGEILAAVSAVLQGCP